MTRTQHSYSIRLSVEQGGKVKAELADIGASGERSFQRIRASSNDASRGLESLTSRATSLQTNISRLTGIIAGLTAAGGLTALANRAITAADAIGKTADRIGVGVESLQALRYAADSAGVSQQTLEMALQRFTRRTAEAAQGTGEAKAALRELGISARDAGGNVRDTEDLLLDAADALKGVENQSDRVRLAFKLFDSQGVKLLQMLQNGSEAMRETMQRARDLGIVLEEELIRNAEEARNELDTLAKVLDANLSRALLDLAPAISDASTWLADLASDGGVAYEKFKAIVTGDTNFENLSLRAVAATVREYREEVEALQKIIQVNETHRDLFTGRDRMSDGALEGMKAKLAEKERILAQWSAKLAMMRAQSGSNKPAGAPPADNLPDPEAAKAAARELARIESALQDDLEKLRSAGLSKRQLLEESHTEALLKLRDLRDKALTDAERARIDQAMESQYERYRLERAKLVAVEREYLAELKSEIALHQQVIDGKIPLEELTRRLAEAEREAAIQKELSNTLSETGIQLGSEQARELERLIRAKEQATRTTEEMTEAEEKAAKAAKKAADEHKKALEAYEKSLNAPFERAAEGIQNVLTDAFESAFDGSLRSADDVADAMKRIFIRAAAEIAAAMVIRPVIGSVMGSVGLGGVAQSMGLSAPSITGLSGGGAGSLFNIASTGSDLFSAFGGSFGLQTSGIGGAINAFGASNLGMASLTPQFYVPSMGMTVTGSELAAIQSGLGFELPATQVGTAVTPGSSMLGAGTAMGYLGAAGLGYGVGSMVFGSQEAGIGGALGSAAGYGIGSSMGTILGMAGGPVGMVLGTLAGSFIGDLFGDDEPSPPAITVFFNGMEHPWAGSNHVNIGNLTSTRNADTPVDAVIAMSEGLRGLITQGGFTLGEDYTVHELGHVGWHAEKGYSDSATGFGWTAENFGQTMLGLFGGNLANGTIQGAAPALKNALNNASDYTEMERILTEWSAGRDQMLAVLEGVWAEPTDAMTQAEAAVQALSSQFDQMAANADLYNIALEEVDAAEAHAKEQMRSQWQSEIEDQLLQLTDPYGFALKQLQEQQAGQIKAAEAVEMGAQALSDLHTAQLEALREQYRIIPEVASEDVTAAERAALQWAEGIRRDLLGVMDPMALAFEELDDWYTEQLAQAEQYQQQTGDLTALYRARQHAIQEEYAQIAPALDEEALDSLDAQQRQALQWSESIRRELLGMTDPRAQALEELERWYAEQQSLAEQHQQQTLELTELYLTKKQAIEEQYAEQAVATANGVSVRMQSALQGINNTLLGLETGNLSTLTQAEQLDLARTAYNGVVQRAYNGDIDAITQLPNLAQGYLTEARDQYASGAGYKSIFDSVRQDLSGLLPSNQSTPAAESDALRNEVSELRADVAFLTQTVERQTQQLIAAGKEQAASATTASLSQLRASQLS
ncbi:hypothetical protein [Magnetofaba australis]|nr:hypothetical protein [Magnetofaba australis]